MDGSQAKGPSVLTSWKDIAQYLGKGVRTVQRWEIEFGLPIRRVGNSGHKSPIVLRVSDLQAWLDSNCHNQANRNSNRPEADALPTTDLDELIHQLQELRSGHRHLMQETLAQVASLIAECDEMKLKIAQMSDWEL